MNRRDNNKSRNLETLLSEWEVDAPVDENMANRVLDSLSMLESAPSPRPAPIRLLLRNPLASTAFACVAVLAFLAAIQTWRLHEQSDIDNQRTAYIALVDPTDTIAAGSNIVLPPLNNDDSIVDMLAWMQSYFKLTREQFAQICEVHRRYEGQLTALYKDLRSIESRYQRFEKMRQDDQMIDFMALYDLLQERNATRTQSARTTDQLVKQVLRILTPNQRREYLSLLGKTPSQPQKLPQESGTHAGA